MHVAKTTEGNWKGKAMHLVKDTREHIQAKKCKSSEDGKPLKEKYEDAGRGIAAAKNLVIRLYSIIEQVETAVNEHSSRQL